MAIFLCLLVGYLLGGINGAIVISFLTQHEDVRTKGSGNAGMTNFMRNYGWSTTVLVIAVDLGKAFLSVWLASVIWPEGGELARMLGGVAAQVGHVFPVFFGFRGGKGILTAAGVAIAMSWKVFGVLLVVFLLFFVFTKYVSLGSVLISTSASHSPEIAITMAVSNIATGKENADTAKAINTPLSIPLLYVPKALT